MKIFNNPIRLIALDLDGCIIDKISHPTGKPSALDFEILQFLRGINYKSQSVKVFPAITIITGRPQPFVEAIMQAIDGSFPAIYENSGLYFPDGYRCLEPSSINDDVRRKLFEVKMLLKKEIISTGLGKFEYGKEFSITIYKDSSLKIEDLSKKISALLSANNFNLSVITHTENVDILPPELGKDIGIKLLSEKTGINLNEIMGIGNSIDDWKFLQLVGFSASPSNAIDEIKNNVKYVSQYPFGRGVKDAIEKCILQNRLLLGVAGDKQMF